LGAAAGAGALSSCRFGAGLSRLRQRGSLGGCDASLDAVLSALVQVGARAVIVAGWGGLARDELPRSVFALDEAPHDWLFPRMAAIVHHGGAGTTGAAVRAGKPSVVIPFITDFPYLERDDILQACDTRRGELKNAKSR